VGSNASSNISFNTQCPPNTMIHPIPRQGSFAFFDPESLTSKKPNGREKGTITYSSVEHVALLSLTAVKAPLSGRKSTRG
jgi:hypothetical protein